MSDNHILIPLKNGRNSIAYYALKSPRNLIIFIHGFGGKSVSTWGEFNLMIKNFQEFEDSDIIFYGYDSIKLQATGNAELLYRSFQEFINPPTTLGDYQRTTNTEGYSQIILVAHSLGALITRRTLLDAKRDNKSWLPKCKLILFAPAHMGAITQNLILECFTSLGPFQFLGAILKFGCPVLADLNPDSIAIKQLISDNETCLQDSTNDNFTKAFKIVASIPDRIVIKSRFCQDPNPEAIENKGHISVCKPIMNIYETPINTIRNYL